MDRDALKDRLSNGEGRRGRWLPSDTEASWAVGLLVAGATTFLNNPRLGVQNPAIYLTLVGFGVPLRIRSDRTTHPGERFSVGTTHVGVP